MNLYSEWLARQFGWMDIGFVFGLKITLPMNKHVITMKTN